MSTHNVRAIQIVEPSGNHSFVLKTDELENILNCIEIRDRHVIVVSVAGAIRQGKSFLLNYFLQFLNAQYKRKNVTEFLENTDDSTKCVNGFSWRSGSKPETSGIMIWSDIFTHDYENGDKVAIILMDTQGSFDSESSIRDSSTIFALSTMLSSVQCYNVMRNIREDDLQYLHLFTEYGKICFQNSDEKPFQDLVFIVRDWPFAHENAFGWEGGQKVIDDRLRKTDRQTNEMQQLRDELFRSFSNIKGILMPYPGPNVAEDPKYNGNWYDMSSKFKVVLKKLVCKLLAPENLVTKKISDQNIRAKDLLRYLKSYFMIFNNKEMPDPKSIHTATADTYNSIICDDAQSLYSEIMNETINEKNSYFSDIKLVEKHLIAKGRSIQQFEKDRKFGGNEAAKEYLQKLQGEVEQQFETWKWINETKKQNYIKKVDAYSLAAQKEAMLHYRTLFELKLANSVFLSEEMINSTHSNLKKESIDLYRSKAEWAEYVHSTGLNEFIRSTDQLEHKINEQFLIFKSKNDKNKPRPIQRVASTNTATNTSTNTGTTSRPSSRQHVSTNIARNSLQIDDEEDYVFECAVCLHADPRKPFVVLVKCGHIVHRRCLQGQTTCPQCRTSYKKETVFECKTKVICNSVCPEAPLSVKNTLEKVSQSKPSLFVFGETQGATSTTLPNFSFSAHRHSINSPFDDGALNSHLQTSSPKSLFRLDAVAPSPKSDWCISKPKTPINKNGYEMFSSVKRESHSHTPLPFTPGRRRPNYTQSENNRLVELFQKYGNNYAFITNVFNNSCECEVISSVEQIQSKIYRLRAAGYNI